MACNITTLEQSACDNGFADIVQNEWMYRLILLQLLCNYTELP